MINVTKIANTIANDGVAERPRKPGAPGEQGEEFAQELLQAGMAAAQPVAEKPELAPELSDLGLELGKEQAVLDSVLSTGAEASVKNMGVGQEAAMKATIENVPAGQDVPRGARSALHSSTIAKSELAQKSAAGTTTAAAIAGLKPWSKDWVLDGVDMARPELKTLFSEGGKEDSQMKSLGEKLKALVGEGAGAQLSPELIQALDAQGARETAAHAALQGAQRGDAGLMASQSEATDAAGLMGLMQLDGQVQNGALESVALSGPVNRPESDPKAKKPLTTQLSGGEFLTALNSVRTNGGVKAAQAQLSGDSGNGGAGNGATGARSQAQSKRPELKMIRGGAENGTGLEQSRFADLMAAPAALHQGRSPDAFSGPNVVELTGQTAKGAGSRDRLSTDATFGLSANIRNLSTNGGGEIRIRLKPEDLGELHLRVVTNGSQVGLQIRASDDRAKKVIEESIGLLKDSLAAQNLNLGKVELAVGQSQGTSMGSDSGNQAQQGHHGAQDLASMMGQEKGQGNREQSQGWARESAPAEAASSRARVAGAGFNAAAARSRAAAASGRLDVTA